MQSSQRSNHQGTTYHESLRNLLRNHHAGACLRCKPSTERRRSRFVAALIDDKHGAAAPVLIGDDEMNSATFQAALQRARAREAADIEAARNGQQSEPVDLYEMIEKQAQERMARAFA